MIYLTLIWAHSLCPEEKGRGHQRLGPGLNLAAGGFSRRGVGNTALVYLKVIHSSVVAFTCNVSRLAALETAAFLTQSRAFLVSQGRKSITIIGGPIALSVVPVA